MTRLESWGREPQKAAIPAPLLQSEKSCLHDRLAESVLLTSVLLQQSEYSVTSRLTPSECRHLALASIDWVMASSRS